MTTHRAECQDCHETYTDTDLLKVSEWAEDHERTEVHDVRIERAVATDGGHPSGPNPNAVRAAPTPAGPPADQYLGPALHKCDLCGQVFDSLNELGEHSCEPVGRGLTDGGITAERYRRQEADSVRQHAGAGHQGRCINGTEGCPGPGGPGLPCTDCFLAEGDR